jgi:hypothetical protein
MTVIKFVEFIKFITFANFAIFDPPQELPCRDPLPAPRLIRVGTHRRDATSPSPGSDGRGG